MNARLQDYLLGLGPHPGDAALAKFTDVELPAGLAERTLTRVEAARASEPRQANSPRWKKFVVAGLAVAAATMLVVRSAPETGDVSTMTARGLDETTPAVALKMAAEHDGAALRLRDGTAYEPGDTLFFRYHMERDGWIHLVHADDEGVHVLTQARVEGGEDDLRIGGEQVVWTLEPGDTTSVFGFVTTNEALDAHVLESELEKRLTDRSPSGQTVDPEDLCAAALSSGLRCDAARVEVDR
ncbi:MAG TPA: hypothetical protein QGF58_10905 [Myxococcota bacterium]|nr:hypothetical protein [Myxococcota bacterium]